MTNSIAVFSDIHSNYRALKNALDVIDKHDVDSCYVLGDIVGYGDEPNKCCDLLRSLKCTCIAGNHDYAVVGKLDYSFFFSEKAIQAIEETRGVINIDNLNWLESLPLHYVTDTLEFVHASLVNPLRWPYLAVDVKDEKGPYQDVSLCFEAMSTATCFVGHTHMPAIFLEKSDARIEVVQPDTYEYALGGDNAIVDVGSVGKPRTLGNQGSLVIFKPQKRELKYFYFDC